MPAILIPEKELTEEEIIAKLGDRKWRLNNLYFVRDERGIKVPFRLNDIQDFMLDNLWYLNIIVKARQLGMCLDPETPVLTADLRWVKIKDINVGTKIISVDEFPPAPHQGRRMRTGIVEGVVRFKRETYRITFEDGSSIICTGKHPWLSRQVGTTSKWMTIDGEKKKNHKHKDRIIVGTRIRRVTKKWVGGDYEDGWVGGMIDGEGSLSKKERAGANLSISQVDGPVWERLISYFKCNGYSYRVEVDDRVGGASSKFGSKAVNKLVLSRMDEIFRLLGTTRPSRFIEREWWVNRELPYMDGEQWMKVTDIEFLGEREVVDLQTSVGTYIADGLVSHNTTFFTILYLDQVLFSENKIAGIIAHKQEDMKKIFRNKILFALDHLHPWLKSYVGETNIDTANEIVFKNGGSIFVSLSARGGTTNFLHISEYGYVCAHSPDKAEEILTGAINSVHAGQMVSIESTAMGREGHFYRLAMEAEKKRKENRELTALDFKSFFFPWWEDPRYVLPDSEFVVAPKEYKDYFEQLENKHGVALSADQKVWYQKKREMMGDKIFQEFPSTFEEAFSTSLEGAYYSKEMFKVFSEKRIGFFPVDPAVEVDTAWDLGMNDQTVILFFQTIGPEIRFVDCYENHGEGLQHYVDVIRQKGYKYGKHILPHDVSVRDLSEGISREQILWNMGIRNTQVAKKTGINDGIEKVRSIFFRFRFNEENTKVLTDALANYRREWDDNLGVWKDRPRHDNSSHHADALRTLASEWNESYEMENGAVNIESFFK